MTTAEIIDREIARSPNFLSDWLKKNRTDFINGKLNDSILSQNGLNKFDDGGCLPSHPPSFVSAICSRVRESLRKQEQTNTSKQNAKAYLDKVQVQVRQNPYTVIPSICYS